MPRFFWSGDYKRGPNGLIEVGFHNTAAAWIIPIGSELKLIGTYANLSKLTNGYKGAIQAHHLIEVRHLLKLGLPISHAPAVILSKAEHVMISNSLFKLLPKGFTYTRTQIMNAYKQAYKAYPEWIEATSQYLGF